MRDSLEEAIQFKSRVRILGAISKEGRLNITQLSRITGLNHYNVMKSIKVLKRIGLIKVYRKEHNHIVESNFQSLAICFEKGEDMTMELI
jgi:predicted transcriptional regulator